MRKTPVSRNPSFLAAISRCAERGIHFYADPRFLWLRGRNMTPDHVLWIRDNIPELNRFAIRCDAP